MSSKNTGKNTKEVRNSELAMLTTRESKKSLRARAKATLRGLTLDTKTARESYRAENPNVAAGGSPTSKSALPDRRENKNDSRGKAESKGHSGDTKLTHDAQKAENGGYTADNRVARKASHADTPRLSEAMMNTNWRNHRRTAEDSSTDMMEPPWSAPPEKSKFPDDLRTKPQRDDEQEFVDYDRDLKRMAYRCRRPGDVKPELIPYTTADSVSAELCLSAPATKTEFSAAEIGTEQRASKYDPSVFQPSVKSVVRLNDMAPTKRAGYERILNWDEQHADLTRNSRGALGSSTSITTVSVVDSSSGWDVVEFPYAEIRAVKGEKKFETGLSNVEETIRNQLSVLVEPQSAGLPPEYLRKEYEERKEERRKAMILAHSTIGGRGRRLAGSSNQESLGTEISKNPEFNDLLGKLNKLCAPRLRAFTVDDKDDACSPKKTAKTQDVANSDPQHSPAEDSGIGSLSPRRRKRSSTLNPEAIEFRCDKRDKKSPVTDGFSSGHVQTAEKTLSPTDSIPDPTPDPIRQLETRVAELEAQLARQGSKKVQFAQPRRTKGNGVGQTPYGTQSYGSMAPGGGAHHPAMNNGVQSPVVYQPAIPVPPHQALPGFGMGARGMHPNNIPGMGQTVPGFSPNGMPFNPTPGMVPFPGHGARVAPAPALGTPSWIKNMFGPKPVSKPDRPFRPGDGAQAMRQQQYEEYLEHLRVTDPSYAQSCKQRQARRADRQRSGQRMLC
ncbi:hypothetical protein ONZ43_g4356 [Nemania bipapillata]|uniref:Uncharacterized protein n=1 Tax=Nemania bipapillata TaxID=110536 RepID=A0ACC2INK7_9PEZI|nr:hypothetical protein ONZ43_g4356 [Nemania bipapillata]